MCINPKGNCNYENMGGNVRNCFCFPLSVNVYLADTHYLVCFQVRLDSQSTVLTVFHHRMHVYRLL